LTSTNVSIIAENKQYLQQTRHV